MDQCSTHLCQASQNVLCCAAAIVDPLVVSLASDIFRSLCENAACVDAVQARLVPTIVSILNAPLEKIPMGMQAVCMAFYC